MTNAVLDLAFQVSRATEENIDLIESVMKQTTLLAINARIEATRAGTAGNAFGVVARELSDVAEEINRISNTLRQSIRGNITKLESVGAEINRNYRGTRFTDLALNAIEIIDRNLYERSCDVRWWATDSAVVDLACDASPQLVAHACDRLATILRSYTVYLDLWVADANGKVIATGRRQKYTAAIGSDVSNEEWYRRAMQTRTGDDFVACDISENKILQGAQVATYATAIRQNGTSSGRRIGALGIFFDWAPQASSVVNGVGLAPEERKITHVMIVDSRGNIIASSNPNGLRKSFRLNHEKGHAAFTSRTGASSPSPARPDTKPTRGSAGTASSTRPTRSEHRSQRGPSALLAASTKLVSTIELISTLPSIQPCAA